MPEERRRLQRDWLGHTIFAVITAVCSIIGTTALIGAPLLSWAASMDASIIRLDEQRKIDDKRIEGLQKFETDVTDNISRASRDLAVLIDHVKGMETSLEGRRR